MRKSGISFVDVFQSTLPTRGATLVGLAWGFYFAFQSTLPTRGATI